MITPLLAGAVLTTTLRFDSAYDFDYKVGSVTCQGFIATPSKSTEKTPVVFIVHDWNGIDTHEKGVAKKLAAAGYIAFAIDVYGKGVRPVGTAACSAEAGKYYGNPDLLHERLKTPVNFTFLPGKKIAIGYCFGGTAVLQMARMNMAVDGVVSFHGGLKALRRGGPIGSKVLVLHGADDPFVPKDQVAEFNDEMKAAKANLKFVSYPGAVHSFTVKSDSPKSSGAAYDSAADTRSWGELMKFIRGFSN